MSAVRRQRPNRVNAGSGRLQLVCAAVMGVGTAVGSWRIIHTAAVAALTYLLLRFARL